jgi:hypothetical protein
MNSDIQLRRIEAAKLAYTINIIEGAPVSDYARRLYKQWVRGEISGQDLKDVLILVHRKCQETND